MNAREFLEGNDLSSALAQASEQLRSKPADVEKRTLLFELLAFTGDLSRALKQLEIVAQSGTEADVAVQRYRKVLKGEEARRRVFVEGELPGLPKQIPAYVPFHIEAALLIHHGQFEAARELLEKAESERPLLSGTINDQPFDDLKDCDDLIGPFLEIITETNYCWLPWEAIRSVSVEPPKHLRDLCWIPARIELHDGPLGECFLPVLYQGSYLHSDDRVKLGRMTEWQADSGGLALAAGQRLLQAGDQDWPLLEVRQIELKAPEVTNGDASAPD
jgi:type VI secretion system protein ImpE